MLRAPKVHLNEDCGEDDCNQHEICCFFKETKIIVDDVLDRLEDQKPIFAGTKGKPVGSIGEDSRVGISDELDVLVHLDNGLVENFEFHSDTQQVTVDFCNDKQEVLEPYTLPSGVFNGNKFFGDYVQSVYNIMENYTIPESCPKR